MAPGPAPWPSDPMAHSKGRDVKELSPEVRSTGSACDTSPRHKGCKTCRIGPDSWAQGGESSGRDGWGGAWRPPCGADLKGLRINSLPASSPCGDDGLSGTWSLARSRAASHFATEQVATGSHIPSSWDVKVWDSSLTLALLGFRWRRRAIRQKRTASQPSAPTSSALPRSRLTLRRGSGRLDQRGEIPRYRQI